MPVCTGSHQDKLAHLVLSRDAAVYGGRITQFPLLGREYVDDYARWLEQRIGIQSLVGPELKPDSLATAFELLWRRPEKLVAAVSQFMESGGTLLESVGNIRTHTWEEIQREFEALTPLEQAVLIRLIRQRAKFASFSSESLSGYSQVAGRTVDHNMATATLERLREAKLVWKSARGTYALENQDFAEWYEDTAPPEPVAVKPNRAYEHASASADVHRLTKCGMSLLAIAECMGVGWRTVKRWSDPASRGPQDQAVRDRLHSMSSTIGADSFLNGQNSLNMKTLSLC